jgi:hypothetical protein
MEMIASSSSNDVADVKETKKPSSKNIVDSKFGFNKIV